MGKCVIDDAVPNNGQIDKTSYYLLPCGKFLEDFIAWKRLDLAEGSALKYLWRAGHKDGESVEKDNAKAHHYLKFLADRGCVDVESVTQEANIWFDQAVAWDGIER